MFRLARIAIILTVVTRALGFYLVVLKKDRNDWWSPETRFLPVSLQAYKNYGVCYEVPDGNDPTLDSGSRVDAFLVYNPPDQVPIQTLAFWEESRCDVDARLQPDLIVRLPHSKPGGIHMFAPSRYGIPFRARSFRALNAENEFGEDGYLTGLEFQLDEGVVHVWGNTVDGEGLITMDSEPESYWGGSVARTPWFLPEYGTQYTYRYLRDNLEKYVNPEMAQIFGHGFGQGMVDNLPDQRKEYLEKHAKEFGRPLTSLYLNDMVFPQVIATKNLQDALMRSKLGSTAFGIDEPGVFTPYNSPERNIPDDEIFFSDSLPRSRSANIDSSVEDIIRQREKNELLNEVSIPLQIEDDLAAPLEDLGAEIESIKEGQGSVPMGGDETKTQMKLETDETLENLLPVFGTQVPRTPAAVSGYRGNLGDLSDTLNLLENRMRGIPTTNEGTGHPIEGVQETEIPPGDLSANEMERRLRSDSDINIGDPVSSIKVDGLESDIPIDDGNRRQFNMEDPYQTTNLLGKRPWSELPVLSTGGPTGVTDDLNEATGNFGGNMRAAEELLGPNEAIMGAGDNVRPLGNNEAGEEDIDPEELLIRKILKSE
ncbi:hypothetical protein H072_11355 [Dactylellina haptotyla CBS 200.50]|uniref:Uncharacterized protein n=1 Tax=Dactylellina haptotyla (strain CBS 200.50) TaxID=1284197 RepID=S7ZXX3_DACHA|nr:hypothetical protein H072_11355 [Dactylellina haptotyla CBS 200.50]